MARKIKVIMKRPGGKPYSTNISNSPENLQRVVDGMPVKLTAEMVKKNLKDVEYVTAITCADALLFPWTCRWKDIDLFGTVVWCGFYNGELCDIPISFQEFKMQCPSMFREAVT